MPAAVVKDAAHIVDRASFDIYVNSYNGSKDVAVCLLNPLLTHHGELCVALSRVRDPKKLNPCCQMAQRQKQTKPTTHHIVKSFNNSFFFSYNITHISFNKYNIQ